MVCENPEPELLAVLSFPKGIPHNTRSSFLGLCPATHVWVFISPFMRKTLRGEKKVSVYVCAHLFIFYLNECVNIYDFKEEPGKGRQFDELLPPRLHFPLPDVSLKWTRVRLKVVKVTTVRRVT